MLIQIGSFNEASDLPGLLNACHDRIRFFVDLAVRLTEASQISHDETRDIASRVVRYFSEALPLHVADEELSILPRLSGRDRTVDLALETMRREHKEHEHLLEQLLTICRTLSESPEELATVREVLRSTATHLAAEFRLHLVEEEQIVLPAIGSLLTEQEREEILREMRNRRNE